MEKDVERLSESFQQLQAAVKRFAQAGNAVKTLGEKKEGTFLCMCVSQCSPPLSVCMQRFEIYMTTYRMRIRVKEIECHVAYYAERIGWLRSRDDDDVRNSHTHWALTQSAQRRSHMCLFVRFRFVHVLTLCACVYVCVHPQTQRRSFH